MLSNIVLLLLLFRSRARLALGNYSGALEDAREALNFAPHYPQVTLNYISNKLALRIPFYS